MSQNTVSIYALLEALRREENDQERSEQFRVLRNQILQGFQNQVAMIFITPQQQPQGIE